LPKKVLQIQSELDFFLCGFLNFESEESTLLGVPVHGDGVRALGADVFLEVGVRGVDDDGRVVSDLKSSYTVHGKLSE
jgi:hypothetical protein